MATLVHRWPMATVDGSGVTPDVVGANPGTAVRSGIYPKLAEFVHALPGVPGVKAGMTFDGGSGLVSLGSVANVTGNSTMTAWIKPNDLLRRSIISFGGVVGLMTWGIGIAGGTGSFEITQPGIINCNTGAGVITAGVLQFVAVTLTGTQIVLFVNRSFVASVSGGPYTLGGTVSGFGQPRAGATPIHEWSGQISDLRIYSGAMSTAEVQALYDSYFTPADPIFQNQLLMVP